MKNYDKYDFEYLNEPFKGWFWEIMEKDWFYKNEFNSEILNELNISEDDLIEKYIDPFNGLSIPQIENILNYLANFLQKESGNPFKFKIKLTTNTLNNALIWTVIFIKDLNLFKLDNAWINHHDYLYEPINQCRVCGIPDSYKRKEADHTGIKFNKKSKYCHDDKCDQNLQNVNYTVHKTCCYGKLAKARHDLRQIFSYEKDKEKNIKYFLKFCDDILKEKLGKNKYSPQVLEPKTDAEENNDKNIPAMELTKAKHVDTWGPKIIPIEKYL